MTLRVCVTEKDRRKTRGEREREREREINGSSECVTETKEVQEKVS